MAEDTDDVAATLDAILATPPSKPCKYAQLVPDELKALIRSRVEAGQLKWVAYQRFLATQGLPVAADTIKQHFHRGHEDSR